MSADLSQSRVSPPLAASDIDEAAAIVWAVDQGAKIINMSLGGTDASPADLEALNYATSRGVFVAVAGGTGFAASSNAARAITSSIQSAS